MSEPQIRLGVFLGVLLAMALWEGLSPRRTPSQKKPGRWLINLGLVALDTVFLRFTIGAAAYKAALLAAEKQWGLLALVAFPPWLELALALAILDFAIYAQHVLSHALPIFWRLHRVHHTDLDFDASTAVRFHPFEIFLSMLYKVALVLALGAPPLAVLIFEVALNGFALFNHGNVYLPPALDRLVRSIIITPDMHRVHHSSIPEETNSNFGFSVPWWDWLCGTYRREPALGQEGMEIGLKEWREPRALGLGGLILLPFRGRLGGYSFERTGGARDESDR